MEGYQEVNEINLIDLMFYCLKKWRIIVVCIVLSAIAAGAYKYQATITDNQVKKEEQLRQSRQSIGEQVEGEEIGSEQSIVFEDPVSLSVSFAVIGMISGACLVCLFFYILYVMGGKVQSENGIQEKFGMALLGVVRKKETKKKLFGFIDRWIRLLEEGPYAKIPRKEQIKIAAVNVQAEIHKNPEKIKRVMLAGTIPGDDVMEICEELVENIGDVVFSPYRQIVFHATALKKLEYYEGILFIEKKGESYRRLIRQEKELADNRNIKVLGMILC